MHHVYRDFLDIYNNLGESIEHHVIFCAPLFKSSVYFEQISDTVLSRSTLPVPEDGGDPASFLKASAPCSFSVLMTPLTNSFIFSDIAHIAFMASLVCCRHPRTAIGDILHILSTMVDLSTTVDVKSRHLVSGRGD